MTNTDWQGCIRWEGQLTRDDLAVFCGQDVHFLPSDFTVDASAFRREGYGPVSEILLILEALEGRAAGASLLVAVSTRIIVETAKLRVLRALLGSVDITSIGDERDLARSDGGTNRVRTTLQAVAGVWGGADRVCVLPHNILERGFADADAARHALAVTRRLQFECGFRGMTDGLQGAEAVEIEEARIYNEIEVWKNRSGTLSDRLPRDRAWLAGPRRPQDEARVITGVNKYT